MKTSIPSVLITLALICFVPSPTVKALLPPPAPDGGYPGVNTAEGDGALFNLTSGIANTAVGFNALHADTTGSYNVAVGSSALASNTTGQQNMAIGTDALTNQNASFNLAIGFRVGFMNTTGNHLTGIGAAALRNNTTASDNTAIGADALRENTIGEENTATGVSALSSNITGGANTATGFSALLHNTTGFNNTAIGRDALFFNTGNNNIALGYNAGTSLFSGNDNIYIGHSGFGTESATIRIGAGGVGQTRTFIAGIRGRTTGNADAVPVQIDSAGQLGTMSSSRRFKNAIKPMDSASEAILELTPVTFHYKSDSKGTPQFGLIAEEVARVNPDLVVRDEKGEIYTVRYEAVNAMLLNEFLKEHRTMQELKSTATAQEATITQLKSTVAQQQKDFRGSVAHLTARLEEQAAQLQKVSAQLEASKPAPQLVVNTP